MKMKKKTKETIFLFWLVILIPFSTCSISINTRLEDDIKNLCYSKNSVITDPIFINHNDNFTKWVSIGNGNVNNPYIIEGFIISNSTKHLIEIVNTTKYFQIKDCDLDGLSGGMSGIKLDDVRYGTILENRIKNCYNGVSLEATNDSIVADNNIYNIAGSGIKVSGMNALKGSNNNTIFRNTVHNGLGFGINNLEFSLFCNISCNTVFNIMANGIMVWDFSNGSSIVNNTVYSCKGHGIGLSSAYKNEIYNNTIFNNTQNGINLVVSNDNEIYYNTIICCHAAFGVPNYITLLW